MHPLTSPPDIFCFFLLAIPGIFAALLIIGIVVLSVYLGPLAILCLYLPIDEVLPRQVYRKFPKSWHRGTVRRSVDVLVIHFILLCIVSFAGLYTELNFGRLGHMNHETGQTCLELSQIRFLVHDYPSIKDSFNKLNALLFIRSISECFAPWCLLPAFCVGIIGSLHDSRQAKAKTGQ